MRPLVQVIVSQLEGVEFVALNLFDSDGQHADQIVKPMSYAVSAVDTVVEMLDFHRIPSADVFTDDEDVFKTFIAIPGVNVSLVSPAELSSLYRILTPDSAEFPLLQELYLSGIVAEKVAKEAPLTLWQRFLLWVKNQLTKGE